MTPENADPLKLLESERDRLESLLQSDDAWRALRQIEEREAEGPSIAASESQGLKSRLEDELKGNRVFLARTKIAEAITLLSGTPAVSHAPVTVPVEQTVVTRVPEPEPQPVIAPDLTRIRGIDRALAERLRRHGVTGFAQIAGWMHHDVLRISTELGLGRAVSRQNWIEQAALLVANTPEAATSANALAVSTKAEETSRQTIEPSPAVEPRRRPLSAVVSQAARAILSRAAVRTVAPLPSPQPVTISPPAPLLPTTHLEAAPQSARPIDLPSNPAPEPKANLIANPGPATVSAADDLTEIRGIDRTLALALRRAGVTGFAAVAEFNSADIARLSAQLGPEARITQDQWVEQAAVLATGRRTRFAQTRDASLSLHVVSRPDPHATEPDAVFAARLHALMAPITPTSTPTASLVAPVVATGLEGPRTASILTSYVARALPVPVLPAASTQLEPSPGIAPTPNPDATATNPIPTGFMALEDEHSLSDMDDASIATTAIVEPARSIGAAGAPFATNPARAPAIAPVNETATAIAPATTSTQLPVEVPSAPQRLKFPDLPPLELKSVVVERAVTPRDLDPAPDDEWPLDAETELPDLSVGEADVEIVSRAPLLDPDVAMPDGGCDDTHTLRPFATSGGPGSLQSRLRSARPSRNIDANDYAAYRSQVEEASVEIVKRSDAGAVRKIQMQPDALATVSRGDVKTVRRFLKALTGQEK